MDVGSKQLNINPDALDPNPSSADRTWSFNSNLDFERITSWTNDVMENYNISREKILLTGFSDGAIYTLTCGLMEESPFTHLAHVSGIYIHRT